MDVRTFACTLIIAVIAALPVSAEEPEHGGLVAVLPLDVSHSTLDDASRIGLEEMIRTTAGDELRPRGFTVLTGDTTIRILEDNGVDLNKVCEASCALSAAKEMKAKMFISGSVTTSEAQFIAFVRLFDGPTGQQLGSIHLEGHTVKDLRDAFQKNAKAFFGSALEGRAFARQKPLIRTVGWTVGAVGVAAVIAAGALGLTVRSDTTALESTVRSLTDQQQRITSINARVTGANVLYGVGGGLAALGAGAVVVAF